MRQTMPRWRRGAGALALAGVVAAIAAGGAAARPDPYEPNDDSAAAVQVPARGSEYPASVAGPGDADWYRVAAPGDNGFLRILASAESPDCDPSALRIRVLNDEREELDEGVLRPAQGDEPGYEYRHTNSATPAYFVVVDAASALGCEHEADYTVEAVVIRFLSAPSSDYSRRDCAFARQDVAKRQRDVRRARGAVQRAKTRRQRARLRRRLAAAQRRLDQAKRVANQVCPGQ